MGFSGQEHWSGLPFPSPDDLPNPGIEPRSPTLLADALPSEPLANVWKYQKLSQEGKEIQLEGHSFLPKVLRELCVCFEIGRFLEFRI